MAYPPSSYVAPPAEPPRSPSDGLSIAALIFSFVVPPVGLALGIVAWASAAKNARRGGMAIAATIIGGVLSVVIILLLAMAFAFWQIGVQGSAEEETSQPDLVQPSASSVTLDVGANAGDGAYLDDVAAVIRSRLSAADIDIEEIGTDRAERIVVNLATAAEVETAEALFRADTVGGGFRAVIAVMNVGAASVPTVLDAAVGESFIEAACPESGTPVVVVDDYDVLCDSDATIKYLVGDYLVTADGIDTVEESEHGFQMTLHPDAALEFATITEDMSSKTAPENQIALIAGGVVAAAPTIQGAISDGVLEITGNNLRADRVLAGNFALLARGESITVVDE